MDLVKLIYDGMQKEADVRAERVGSVKRFRASEATQCSRRIWYRLSGYQPEPDPAWLRLVAEEGNILHDYVRQLLMHFDQEGVVGGIQVTEHGEVLEDDVLTLGVSMDGEDFVISGRPDGTLAGDTTLEIKTMGHWMFHHLNKAFVDGGFIGVLERLFEKHEGYMAQTMLTALLQGHTKCYLLVVNRSDMQVGLYNPMTGDRHPGAIFEIEDDLILKLMKKFARISKAVREGKPPLPPYLEGSEECSRCPFYKHCWGALGVSHSSEK